MDWNNIYVKNIYIYEQTENITTVDQIYSGDMLNWLKSFARK